MFLRVFILIVSWVTVAEMCMRMIPPDGAYITSTEEPMDECETCDIDEIAPTMEAGTSFESKELAATGACKSTQAICKRNDGKTCSKVIIKGTNPSGETILLTENNKDQATVLLTCQSNGFYSSGTTTEISELSCEFEECVLACSTCDINTIAPAPASLPTDTTFDFVQQGAGDCKETQVTCKRSDDKTCSVLVTGTNPTGTSNLVTVTDTNQASTVLTCGADGKYQSGATTQISQLGCAYTDCTSPCEKCDVNTIAPESMMMGTEFVSTENAPGGVCKSTTVTCRRIDDSVCDEAMLIGTSAAGETVFASDATVKEISATLECKGDGTYSWQTVTGITRLECRYTRCFLPCLTCDIGLISGPIVPGGDLEVTELAGTGECKSTQVKCVRNNGQFCSVSVDATNPTAISSLVTQPNSAEATAILTCDKDGFYTSGTVNQISAINCGFTNCVDPCQTCDIMAISPLATPTGSAFEVLEQGGPCKQTQVTCRRTDGATCGSISLMATNALGTTSLINLPGVGQVGVTLGCAGNGAYAFDATTGITRLECVYTDCKLPCETCDIAAITPAPSPGNGFEFLENPVAPGTCKSTQVKCLRTNGEQCTVSVRAINPSGPTTLDLQINAMEATATLTCGTDGKYQSGATTAISAIQCAFNGCVLPCATCDISAITPAANPAGTTFEAVTTSMAGACTEVMVTCRRTDTLVCSSISIMGTFAVGTTDLSTVNTAGSTQVSTTLTCGADGKFSSATTTGLTALSCGFNNCVQKCASCNPMAVAPTMPTGTTFEIVGLTNSAAGCRRTQFTCRRTDGLVCDSVSMTTQSGQILTTSFNADAFSAALTCGDDGAYSYPISDINGITGLVCNFVNCKSRCQTCNIISLVPTMPTGTAFQSLELPPLTPCKQTYVSCRRTDGLVCDTVSVGTSTGQTLVSGSNLNNVGTTLTCAADGTYSFAMIAAISKLTCNFVNCRPTCQLCDMSTITPLTNPAGTTFEFTTATVAGCSRVTATCRRLDTQVCSSISLTGTTAAGTTNLATVSAPGSTQASAILTCESDRKFSVIPTTGLTALSCVYTGCVEKCTRCNAMTLAPAMPAGTAFQGAELAPTGSCKQTQLTCRRTDGLVCDSVSVATSTGTLSTTANADSASIILTCSADGTYSAGMITAITSLTCNFVNCKQPCERCDLTGVTLPTNEAGAVFEINEIAVPGTCTQTEVACRRTDGMLCLGVFVEATTDLGPIQYQNGPFVDFSTATLICEGDGTYSVGPAGGLTKLECAYDNCFPACQLCDMGTIAPPTNPPGTTFEFSTANVGGCSEVTVTCRRLDTLTCSSIILTDTTAGVTRNLSSVNGAGSTEVSAILTCESDRTFSLVTITGLTALSCVYNGCV